MCYKEGKDAPAKSKDKGIDIKELQEQQHREGVAIVCEIREKADECHNNNGNRTFEDWERMSKWLLEIAYRLEYGLGYRRDEKIIKEIEEAKKSADKDALTEEFFNKLGEES